MDDKSKKELENLIEGVNEELQESSQPQNSKTVQESETSQEDLQVHSNEEEFGFFQEINEKKDEDIETSKPIDQPEDIQDSESIQLNNEKSSKKKKKATPEKRRKNLVNKIMLALIIVALSGLFSVIILLGFKDMYGLSTNSEKVEVYIERGSSTAMIAKALQKNHIVSQPWLFRIYCKLNDAGNFQYGAHDFSDDMSYSEIIRELGKLAKKKDVVSITVKEGWALGDIADELKTRGVIADAKEFIAAVNRAQYDFEFTRNVPDKKYRYYKYEGYFYPDTYEFYLETTDYTSIAKKFFSNFEANLDSDVMAEITAAGKTLDEVLTLASIIEKEAGNINQMGMVSSVFHNRMKKPTVYPKLESDVTIFYVENYIKKSIEYPYQEMYDAYNTYKAYGLPPGPICSPSKQALRAAILPEKSSYYYFVTDNTGKYYYSRTLSEHNRNIKIAENVNKKLASKK